MLSVWFSRRKSGSRFIMLGPDFHRGNANAKEQPVIPDAKRSGTLNDKRDHQVPALRLRRGRDDKIVGWASCVLRGSPGPNPGSHLSMRRG